MLSALTDAYLQVLTSKRLCLQGSPGAHLQLRLDRADPERHWAYSIDLAYCYVLSIASLRASSSEMVANCF